jgi:hypothetical protein
MAVAAINPAAFNKVNDGLDDLRPLMEVSSSTKGLFYSFLTWYLPMAEKAKKNPISVKDAATWIRTGGVAAIKQLQQAIGLLRKQLDQRLDQAMTQYTRTKDISQVRSQQENISIVRNLEDDILGCQSNVKRLQEGLLYIVTTVNRTSPSSSVTQGMRDIAVQLEEQCLRLRRDRLHS